MKNRIYKIKLFLSVCFSLLILSCGLGGSSGGGGDEIVAANANIDAFPRDIDSGERIRVTIFLSQVKEGGVLLKVKYSNRLAYVNNTTKIKIREEIVDINPAANETINNNLTYLVYDLPGSVFGQNDFGELEFLLEGQGRLIRGDIEVDADINDSNLSFSDKFTTQSPEFDAEAMVEVNVIDSSGVNPATITPTPTITLTPSITPTLTPTRTPRPSLTPTAVP